jgi:hypothetical protein
MSIWGHGVKEAHRRKHTASALIAGAMRSSHRQGARFASVGTQLWNAPAHATYAPFGYVPHTLLIGRTPDLSSTTWGGSCIRHNPVGACDRARRSHARR